MSYILDALRKSDDEHRNSAVKPIRSGLSFSRRPISRRRRNTFGLILISCMLIAGLILGTGLWWSHWESERTSADIAKESARESSQEDAGRFSQTVTEEPPLDVSVAFGEQNNQTETAGQAENQTPGILETPTAGNAVQESLPDLHFSGHVYSPTPGLRMIMINNAVVREGQFIEPDLSLIEITRTGVVLRFKDTTYEIDLF